MGTNGGHRFFRPQERAIVLVVVFTIVTLIISLFDTGVGVERRHWLDFAFAAASNGITGLVSALTPLWRILAGLLVVSPLDNAADMLLGRADAWNPIGISRQFVESTFLTWLLPHLDPPAIVQRWIAKAQSRPVAILRKGSVYVAYGIWLFVVFMAIAMVVLFAAEAIRILTGQAPASESLTGLERVALAGTVACVIAWGGLLALARGARAAQFLVATSSQFYIVHRASIGLFWLYGSNDNPSPQ